MDAQELGSLSEFSRQARKLVHDANNALFVAKGFAEEIGYVVKDEEYLKPDFRREELVEMIQKVIGNLDKVGEYLKTLGKCAREDVFAAAGSKNPE
jgi:hypothetical protein